MSEMKKIKKIRPPSYLDTLIPIITLIILLASAIYLFGVDDTSGPIQVALMLSIMVAPQEWAHQAGRGNFGTPGQSRLLWNRWSKGRAYRARSGCHGLKAFIQKTVDGIMWPIKGTNIAGINFLSGKLFPIELSNKLVIKNYSEIFSIKER